MTILNKLAWAVLAFVLIVATIIGVRSCGQDRKLAQLQADYKALSIKAQTDTLKAQSDISALQSTIASADAEIGVANAEISQRDERIKMLTSSATDLEKQLSGLTDRDAIIANLKAQVVVWKQDFTLAEQTIADKDKIIFDLTAKYDAQVKVAADYKLLYEDQLPLVANSAGQIKILTGQLARAKSESLAEKVIIGIAAGYIGYRLISK